MPYRRLPRELGELVAVHRPVNPLLAWGLLAALSSPFAILFALGPPGPLVGLAVFFGFLVPFAYMFAEWILLQHRIYRHGIVFCSIRGAKCYVIPFYTVDPDRIEVTGRHQVPKGQFRLAQPEHRESPAVETSIRLDGPHPKVANRLAKGKVGWHEAGTTAVPGESVTEGAGGAQVVAWQASFRDPERYRRLLRDTVADSTGRPRNP